ncbi:winged helix-turn-helix domain-containing protein [Rheinheimera sp. WS51]|uniref:winged helix-turn-helix domain-containing protein n=1 Tax=Rheinheimera sp. WS51 TaxID=3425886 RepID=UPI003D8B6EDF
MAEREPVVLFGDWHYEVIEGRIRAIKNNTDGGIRLEPLLQRLLNFFIQQPTIVLSKQTLLENVWSDDSGSDAAVMRAIGALRKVLKDDVKAPRYIQTMPREGYCWIAEVTKVEASQSTETQITTLALLAEPVVEPVNKTAINQEAAPEAYPLVSKVIQPALTQALSPIVGDKSAKNNQSDNSSSWRFVLFSTLMLLICSASVAYILSIYTTDPLLKMPDSLVPISALNGQEYWPILNVEQTEVIFQHKKMGQSTLSWVQQSLISRRVRFLKQDYLALAPSQWLDNNHIIFSGQTDKIKCGIYKQQLYPEVAKPALLWRCKQHFNNAVVRWQDQWLWLDLAKQATEQQVLELWLGDVSQTASLLASFKLNWHSVSATLLQQNKLLMLAHESPYNTVLVEIDLKTQALSIRHRFDRKVSHMTWWDKSELLLSGFNQQLQIYDLKAGTEQSLGPLSQSLIQPLRYPRQVLATQYLNYTSDIYHIDNTAKYEARLSAWQVSNRSEYLPSKNGGLYAYVSERTGLSQVWLHSSSGENRQLTQFTQAKQLRQLFWHKNQLMLVANNQLYQLDPSSSELTLAQQQAKSPGRYTSCQQQLFWTELNDNEWQLFTESEQGPKLLYKDVVDVRCGINQQLVIQQATDPTLQVISFTDGKVQLVKLLPVGLDWRQLTAQQWFTDRSGIYWLNPITKTLDSYLWSSQQVKQAKLPDDTWPLGIYSNENGLGFIVKARPFDTDIVWLQQRN